MRCGLGLLKIPNPPNTLCVWGFETGRVRRLGVLENAVFFSDIPRKYEFVGRKLPVSRYLIARQSVPDCLSIGT